MTQPDKPRFFERNGQQIEAEWFQTHTGRRFFPMAPEVRDVELADIAHALARICRFGGHTRGFYSVAQHSVLVSQVVEQECFAAQSSVMTRSLLTDPPRWKQVALQGLFHDAAEAYLGDMIRPLKVAMPDYKSAELALERVIAQRFGLVFPFDPLVKHADDILLATERRDLLAHEREWTFKYPPMTERIVEQSIERAEASFLARAAALLP